MSVISTGCIQKSSYAYTVTGTYTEKTKSQNSSAAVQQESVVDDYKRRHPESAAHVDKQVQAGKKVRAKNGAENISREDMTMEEYQKYFYSLLDTIPYDSTRVYDENLLSISDKGWEQMKKDPDYEAWILGYFVEDRAVRNPFFGWGGNSGMIIFEHFGASIDEHHGEGYSKSAINGDKTEDEEESWWMKRRKKTKELLEEQQLKAAREAKAKEAADLQEYRNHQLKRQQNLHAFLTGQSKSFTQNGVDDSRAKAEASAAYETVGLFHSVFDVGGTQN